MPAAIKSLIRRFFYRSPLFRLAVGGASILTRRTQTLGISHLLSYVDRDALGPLQRDEAIAMFGIVRTLRPKTVVEFGFFHGHSAFNFLCALDPDAKLFSYDVGEESAVRARRELSFDKRLTFHHKSQTAFKAEDIEHRLIDFVFLDAAHELGLNVETFNLLLPSLAPGAVIAIHDTGLWKKSFFSDAQAQLVKEGRHGRWVTEDLYAHQPEEREFVDWILANHPDFAAVHLHSQNTLRHGFSLFQRASRLSNSP